MSSSVILQVAARFLAPLLVLFSIVMLLRGHNNPGGGFIGALIAVIAIALYSLARGVEATRTRMKFNPHALIGIGLAVAIVSGLPAFFFGQPFMTGYWVSTILPLIGEFNVGTPLLFDVGVYLTVIGVVVTMIFTLSE
jgi:multicomponent Na+:H+ antiporter subunit B